VSRGRNAVLERRARLVEQAERERDQLSRVAGPWRTPMAVVDRGLEIARGIRRSAPVIGIGVGIGMAALAILRPKGLGEWLRRGQAAWQVVAETRKARQRAASGEVQAADG
jgi:hypothetical protein